MIPYMPATAPLKDLEAVQLQIMLLKSDNPEYFERIQELLRKNRHVGYKNICKLILEEATPRKLKGIEED